MLNRLQLTYILLCLIIFVSCFAYVNDFTLKNNNVSNSIVSPSNIRNSQQKNLPTIAFVRPDFTTTAYSSFYSFFSNSSLNPVQYLIKTLKTGWGTSTGAPYFINDLLNEGYPSNKIFTIGDLDVHNNKLYDRSGEKLYSTLCFFHSEYVTKQEYINVINYIALGGNVILLNGNSFYSEITYDNVSNSIQLLNGHGYEFDGKIAIPSYNWRFNSVLMDNLNFNYIGSRFCSYYNGVTNGAYFDVNNSNPNPIAVAMVNSGYISMASRYISHEENCLITTNVDIIANWRTSFSQADRGIKIYEFLPFGPFGGSLIDFGFFGSDILNKDYSSRLAFVLAVKQQNGLLSTPWIRYPENNGVYSSNEIAIDFTQGWDTDIYLNGTYYPNMQQKSYFTNLNEGLYNLTIKFNSLNYHYIRTVFFSIDRTAPEISFSVANNSLLTNYSKQNPITINVKDKHPEYY